MSDHRVDAHELLRLGQAARNGVEETTDWRRVLSFRVLSLLLLGLHTSVALIALTRPEFSDTGLVMLIVPGMSCWTSASTAHLRSQRVVLSGHDRLSWLPMIPFLAVMLLSMFTDWVPVLWQVILCGVAAVALGLPLLRQAIRPRSAHGTPIPRAGTQATPRPQMAATGAATDWTLWVIAISLGTLCALSATNLHGLWALPFLLVLPWLGWRAGRWPLPVFFGLAGAVILTYVAALLRGYHVGHSAGTSALLGLLAFAMLAIPALAAASRR